MKLLDQVCAKIRTLHYSYRTEQSYVRWIVAFIRFHQLRHPSGMGGPEIEEFLTHLTVRRQVSASTQNQAFNAVVFLFKHILGKEPGEFKAVRAKRRRHLPMVLPQAEIQRVLAAMERQLLWRREIHLQDLGAGEGWVGPTLMQPLSDPVAQCPG